MFTQFLALFIKLNSLLSPETGLSQKIDSYLLGENFQGSVLIGKEGKILFSKGYGFANAEHQILCTPKTVFRIGSITKQFTAVALLQLQVEGLLNVNDPISKYLPDYPKGEIITIHHLLSHTSGIPSITRFSNLSEIQRHHTNPTQVMDYFKDLPLEFSPGSECKYSDSGYIILGAIIEKVAHIPYEQYLKDHFFQPLGMKNTYFDHNQKLIANRASGYSKDENNHLINAEFVEMSFPHAAGSLTSTVTDLYLWDRALKESSLLPEKINQLLFTLHAGSEQNSISYGYGFFIDTVKHVAGHKGSIEGFRAASYRYSDDDLTVIVLSNQEKISAINLQAELASLTSSWRL